MRHPCNEDSYSLITKLNKNKHIDTRYSRSNKQVPGATAVQLKERSVLVSTTWKSLAEVTFALRLKNESDIGMGKELKMVWQSTDGIEGKRDMWSNLTEA